MKIILGILKGLAMGAGLIAAFALVIGLIIEFLTPSDGMAALSDFGGDPMVWGICGVFLFTTTLIGILTAVAGGSRTGRGS